LKADIFLAGQRQYKGSEFTFTEVEVCGGFFQLFLAALATAPSSA